MLRIRCPSCGGEVPLPANGMVTEPACGACGRTFPCDGGIVDLKTAVHEDDYPGHLHDIVANVEDRHFWFAARNDIIVSTMRRVLGPLVGQRMLDVGCGSGLVLSTLERAGLLVCGVDMHRTPLRKARTRMDGPLVCSEATPLPFYPDFDLAGAFDVIEHVEDDQAVLRQIHTVLKPGGHVIVTVPAGAHLRTSYDDVIGHKRRYDRSGLTFALAGGGFDVRYVRYFNCLPLVVQQASRRFAARLGDGSRSDLEIVRRALRVPPEPFNSFLRVVMMLEQPFGALPFVTGGSLIAIGQKTT